MNNIIKNTTTVIIAIAICVVTITAFANGKSKTDGDKSEVPVRTSVSDVTTTSTPKTTKPQVFKPYSRYNKTNRAPVRTKPNKNGSVVKRLSLGKKVKIVGTYGNWRKLGNNQWIHKKHLVKKDPTPRYQGVKLQYSGKYNITKNKLTRSRGVVRYNGHKETWYSSHEYGQTQTAYHIPGKHLASDGTYRDKDGYICVAANYLSKGSTIMTSLGPGKVYDRGGMRGQWIDIYTNWR